MAFKDLGGFLRRLEDLGELRRVAVEVDPLLEIAEITDRVSKSPAGGSALLFEKVRGSGFPVITNMFGSMGRICLALGVGGLDDLSRRMEELLESVPSVASGDILSLLPQLPEFSRYAPQLAATGACREVTESRPDLGAYPVLKNFAGDGRPDHDGRFITLPLVTTRDPETGKANCAIYRVEVIGRDSVCIHWRATSGGAGHFRRYLERGERMPVAVVLGGDPAVTYAASAPLPESVDEMHMAGFLRREPVAVVKCLDSQLLVPADSEMVIEGFIDPGDTCRGGAFGNHTGYYSTAGDVPVMRVTRITRRKDMIYPATVVGRPPMEDCWLAKASERLMLPVIRRELPEIREINTPLEGIFHGCAIVAVEKSGPDTPRLVVDALWKKRLLGEGRLIVVVDGDTDVRDIPLVAWRVVNHVDWRSDIVVDVAKRDEMPLGRIGLDATRKAGGLQGNTGHAAEIGRGESVVELVGRRWREYGL